MKNILLFAFSITFLVSGCKKEVELPVFRDISINSISPYSAIVEVRIQPNDIDVSGNINYIEYSKLNNIDNLYTEKIFMLFRENNFRLVYGLNDLDPNTTYNIEALFRSVSPYKFLLKSHSITFSTGFGDSLYDIRDGNYYKTIIIGNQEWMAENLRYTRFNKKVIDGPSKNVQFEDIYYNFQEALNVCPVGYKLPSDEDWMELEKSLGIETTNLNTFGYRGDSIGMELKASGVYIWQGYLSTNSSGFSALPTGFASKLLNLTDSSYTIGGKGYITRFISSTSSSKDSTWAVIRTLESDNNGIKRNYGVKRDGYSVRCLKIIE